MKTIFKFLRAGSVALLSLNAANVSADMADLNVSDSFKYATRRTITVNMQVNTPDVGPVGLSFYNEGDKGLRLLFSVITDDVGHYQGQLSIPAALKTLVVKTRWINNFKNTRVAIKNNAITTTIDYKPTPKK
jgi:hypothetical protein